MNIHVLGTKIPDYYKMRQMFGTGFFSVLDETVHYW